jgi:hypothetical protein
VSGSFARRNVRETLNLLNVWERRRMKHVRLSKTDVTYLLQSRVLPGALAQSLEALRATADEQQVALPVSREVAERVRASLTELAARVGFDGQYAQTDEGRLIEALIDRFFIDEQ